MCVCVGGGGGGSRHVLVKTSLFSNSKGKNVCKCHGSERVNTIVPAEIQEMLNLNLSVVSIKLCI